MQLHAPQTQWHTIEKPSFSLKAAVFVLVTQWKMAAPACRVLQSYQHSEPGRRKMKAARRQCLPFESIYLRACLQPFSVRHLCCAPATSPKESTNIDSKTPARLFWGTLHVIRRGNTSSKARVSGTVLFGKKNKNPAPKQTVQTVQTILLLFIFNCTRNELFWSTILKVLEKFCQVLEKHSVILKLQSDKLLLWENNYLLNDWAGGLNRCCTQAGEGTEGAHSAPFSNFMQATDFNNIWTSPHWYENLKELLCSIFGAEFTTWPEFGHRPENTRMVPQHVHLCLVTIPDW